MIKNDKEEEKQQMMNKLIIATFLALVGSLLSTIFITSAQAADIVPNEIQINAAHAGKASKFESSNMSEAASSTYRREYPNIPFTG
jgi:hypothetical protein